MFKKPMIELIGDDVEIAGIEKWLEQQGRRLVCATVAEPMAIDARERLLLRLFVIGPQTSARALCQRIRQNNRDGVASAACVSMDDRNAMSKALALGLDDVLVFAPCHFPLRPRVAEVPHFHVAGENANVPHGVTAAQEAQDDRRLLRQLDQLAMLARARLELLLREAAAMMLRPGEHRPRRAPPAPGAPPALDVLLVGSPSQAKVRTAEALGPVAIAHADTTAMAQRLLASERQDIAILCAHDDHGLRMLEGWPVTGRRSAPLTLAITDRRRLHGEELDAWMQRHGVTDTLTTSMSIEEMHLHLHFWQEFALVRKRLLRFADPTPAERSSGRVPGAVSRDFLQAYLEQRRQSEGSMRQPVYTLRLEDLWDIAAEQSYELAGELLERMVSGVIESLGLFDIASYCGNGQMIVLLEETDGRTAPLEVARKAADRALARLADEMGEYRTARPHFAADARLLDLDPDIDLGEQLHDLLGTKGQRIEPAGASCIEQRVQPMLEPA